MFFISMHFMDQVCMPDITFKYSEVNAMSFVDPLNISVEDQVENIFLENKEDFPFSLLAASLSSSITGWIGNYSSKTLPPPSSQPTPQFWTNRRILFKVCFRPIKATAFVAFDQS